MWREKKESLLRSQKEGSLCMFPYVQVGKVVFQCMKGQIQAQLTRNKVVST